MGFRSFLTALLAVGFLSVACGQNEMHLLQGPGPGSGFGRSIASVADLDGDGSPEFLVGAPDAADPNGNPVGAVYVYSGRDAALIRMHLGTVAGSPGYSDFGFSLDSLDDVDGDGIRDYAVSAPGEVDASLNPVGAVHVYSGASGLHVTSVHGTVPFGAFGLAVEGCGDLDGDRAGDFLVSRIPEVTAFSGSDGRVIHQLTGSSGDDFGRALAALGDLDGDGLDDIAVSSPGSAGGVGRIDAYSSASWNVLWTIQGSAGTSIGGRICELSDRDHDGLRDLASSVCTPVGCAVSLFSGATGAFLSSPGFGPSSAIADAGDVNGDGLGDLLRGAAAFVHGSAHLHSGDAALVLYHFIGNVGDETMGVTVAGLGDLNGDGLDEIAVANLGSASDPDAHPGEVHVYTGSPLYLEAAPHKVHSGSLLSLDTRQGAPGLLTVLFAMRVNGSSCICLIGGIGSFDATGNRALWGVVPPALSGLEIDFQSFAQHASGGLAASGLEKVVVE